MTASTETRRGTKGDYASALLYFGPICLPYAAISAYLYYHSIGGMPALWLIPVVVSIVVWIVVSAEVAEF